MHSTAKFDLADYENLARVAEGRGSVLDDACAERLIAAGLVLRMDVTRDGCESLQLTAGGLALIRSSDQ
jgi:hypothetical protein